jgi:DNA repair protein SbcD/Mre11
LRAKFKPRGAEKACRHRYRIGQQGGRGNNLSGKNTLFIETRSLLLKESFVRFIHTADWHLGRIFHSIHLTQDQAYVLERFVEMVKELKPDAVIISGDIYDRSVPPPEAVELLDKVFSRLLIEEKIPVLVIAGNHDSPERLGFGEQLFARQHLHVRSVMHKRLEPVILEDSDGPVYFCPIPYLEPVVVKEKLALQEISSHDQAMGALVEHILLKVPEGARRVAVAHTFVIGGEGSESERPLSVGGLSTVSAAHFSRFNYAALGHLHASQQVSLDTIRYAGSILKYSFAEAAHAKSAVMVEIDGRGRTSWQLLPLEARRDLRIICGSLREIAEGAKLDTRREDYIMAMVTDPGALFDPLGVLRKVYPNVLQIGRPESPAPQGRLEHGGDHRHRSEIDLFRSFFRQVQDRTLSDAEDRAMCAMIEDFAREKREA